MQSTEGTEARNTPARKSGRRPNILKKIYRINVGFDVDVCGARIVVKKV